MTARPCRSASLATRTGLPSEASSALARSKPCHAALPRLAAVSTRPPRTTPGKPTETRWKAPSGSTSFTSTWTIWSGVSPTGVSTRTRSVSILPSWSMTAAFSPVPPTSMHNVRVPGFVPVSPRSASAMSCLLSLPDRRYRDADEHLAQQRHQRPARLQMLLDGLEREPGGFRHPQQREQDTAQADHGKQGEGEGEPRSGQHQREGEHHHEVEAPVADRGHAHARSPCTQRENFRHHDVLAPPNCPSHTPTIVALPAASVQADRHDAGDTICVWLATG